MAVNNHWKFNKARKGHHLWYQSDVAIKLPLKCKPLKEEALKMQKRSWWGDAGGQWNGGPPAWAPKQGGRSGQYPQIEGPGGLPRATTRHPRRSGWDKDIGMSE